MKPMQVQFINAATGQLDGWAVLDAAGQIVEAGQGADTARKGHDSVLIVPGGEIAMIRLQLPARLKGEKALAAARFAAEDQLGQGVGASHFVLSLTPDRQLAFAVDPARMEDWRRLTDAAGLVPDAIFPVQALVPQASPAAWRVGDEVVLCSESDCVALAPDMAASVVAGLPAHSAPMTAPDTETVIGWARDLALGDPSGGLLQGRFGAEALPLLAGLGRWRTPLIAASIAGGLGLGLVFAEGLSTLRLAEATEARALASYLTVFPDAAPVRNLRAEVRNRMQGGAQGGASLMALTVRLYAALEGANGITLVALRGTAQEASLSATLSYSDYGALQTVIAGLSAIGLDVTEGTSRARGAVMVTDIRIGDAT